jgi:hypothetical protein
MARGNFNTQTKRRRELAKKDKRTAKDEKRGRKKVEARATRTAPDGTAPAPRTAGTPAVTPASVSSLRSLAAAAFIRRMNKTP